MKILSIDFDYFQDVSYEMLRTFPPGMDVPSDTSEIIWARHYARQAKEIEQVGILEEPFRQTKELLLKQRSEIPVMIAGSHVEAYYFIHQYASKADKHLLVNIDMHHDMFNDNPDVDCGNWIGFLEREYPHLHPLWICNPVSKEMYGIEEKDVTGTKRSLAELIPETLDGILSRQFDLIFLCKSDIWLPPHLDNRFTELSGLIQSHFENVYAEADAIRPRKDYLSIAEDYRRDDTYLDEKLDIFALREIEKERKSHEKAEYDFD